MIQRPLERLPCRLGVTAAGSGRSLRSRAYRCAAVLFLACHLASAQSLVPALQFGDRAPWRVYGPLGGAVTGTAEKGTICLTTERVQIDDAESWEGCITTRRKAEVIPSRRHRLAVEARGFGELAVGMFEYPWRHSEKLLASHGKRHTLTDTFQEFTFDYAGGGEEVSHARPYLRLTGWHARAELRNCSLVPILKEGTISVTFPHFIAPLGGEIEVGISSSHWPVKLLLYGPSGECGPAGPMGGAKAWTDHFVKAWAAQRGPDEAVIKRLSLKGLAVEGTYRLVAISPETGQAASVRFTLRPAERLKKIVDLVEQVRLPEGSRLAFVGDSLTALFPRRNYVALLDRAFRWRFGGKVEVFNAAVGGSNIRSIEKRLDGDVINRRPTHVFLFEGANDSKRYYAPATKQLRGWAIPPPVYEETLRRVVQRVRKETKAQVVMMTCAPGNSAIRDAFQERSLKLGFGMSFFCLPDEIAKIVAIQKRVAADLNLDVIDTNALLSQYMAERARAKSPQYAHVDDGVHISEYGSREVALAVLRYLARQR